MPAEPCRHDGPKKRNECSPKGDTPQTAPIFILFPLHSLTFPLRIVTFLPHSAYAALSSLFASRQPCDEKPMLPTACAAIRAAGNLSPSPHIHFRTNASLPKIFPAPTCATLAVTLHSGRHPAKPS